MKKKEKQTKKIKAVKAEIIRDTNDDTNVVWKLILILSGVAIVAFLLYFISAKYLVKDNFQDEEESAGEVTITYDRIDVGNIFNRPYDEYYVLAYDPESLEASKYAALLNSFNKENEKIYFVDLSKKVNASYKNETGNSKASKPSEISLKDPTLMKIKKGAISKYIEEYEKIKDELK